MKTRLPHVMVVARVLVAALAGGCAGQPSDCKLNQDCPAGQLCNQAAGICSDISAPAGTSPLLQWVKQYGSTGRDGAYSVALAANGDILVAGSFSGTVDFGGGPLTSAGESDVFLARVNSAGTLLWAESFGGPGDNQAYGVALDPSGNIFLTGAFQGTASFGGAALASAGDYDIFLARYGSDGTAQWSQRFGGTTADSPSSVAADGTGAVTITGYFTGTADFGCEPITSHGGTDVFVARYNGAGTYLWARGAGGADDDIGNRVAVAGGGDVVVVGSFQDSADFGNGALTSAGQADVFVARYTPSGGAAWSKSFGGTGVDTARGVAVDATGTAYVFGEYQGAVDFGGGPLPADAYDLFLASFSATGAPVWSESFAATAPALSSAIAVNAAGTLALTGKFNAQVDLHAATGPVTGGGVFLAQVNPDGSNLWSLGFSNPTNMDEDGLGVAIDGAGDTVACGDFAGTATFGTSSLTSAGDYDAFLLRLTP